MIHNFFDFCDRAMGEAKTTFVAFPYMRKICQAAEDCVAGALPGGAQNLILTVPPRHYKTTIMSQFFPAWCLGEIAPDCEFILTSFSERLAVDNAMAIKRTLLSEWYSEQYPRTRISRESKNLQQYFRTTAGGSIYAVGLGGTITGFGAGKVRRHFGGAIIIDDPIKALEASSMTMREKCVKYYTDVLSTRRNNMKTTPIIVIMQRLHVDDLVGWLLKNEPGEWHLVNFPAISNGKLLNPVTTTMQRLMERKETSPAMFYAQYMQSPVIEGGNIIKTNWWSLYDPEQLPQGFRFITADTAYKEKSSSDESVMQIWQISEKGMYFIDSMYGRWGFPELLQNAQSFWRIADAREFWVEDKASGGPLVQTLNDNDIPANGWLPGEFNFPADKVSRMEEAAWIVHGGHVHLPRGNVEVRVSSEQSIYVTPGAAALAEQCAQFAKDMSHAHDDHCDAFTMAVSLYKYGV